MTDYIGQRMGKTPWIGSCPFCGGIPEVEVFIRCVRHSLCEN